MAFLLLDFSLRFLIVLYSILVPFWVPKWLPGGAAELVLIGPGAVQDGLGIVLVRSFFVLRFGIAFWSPSGASWTRFGAPLASFWVILGSLGPVLGRLGLS